MGAHGFLTLLIFTIVYFFLACWTYGMFISSGLFVPSLLIGASWGRLTGMCLVAAFPNWNWGDLGKYALIGASAQLAGTIRLTYSLTAIILEATGNLTYIFPVFVTVLIAKIVGDFINEGKQLAFIFKILFSVWGRLGFVSTESSQPTLEEKLLLIIPFLE